MIVRFTKSVLLAVVLILALSLPVLAAWDYLFPTGAADTSFSTRTYYPVMMGFNGQAFIDADKIASNGTDTNMQIAGSDIKYMLSTDNVAAVIPNLPAGGVVTVNFYTGWTPAQTAFPIVVGEDGYVTVADDDDLEPSNNFTIEINGYLKSIVDSIAYKSGAYRIGVLESGNITGYLVDEYAWETQTNADDISWYGIAWSPELELFVAVSTSGVMTSSDGITWTSRTIVGSGWIAIAWSSELSLFVAVSTDGGVMTSPDGITWTLRTSAVSNYWEAIEWSPELELFAAVSGTGTGDRVMTSPDGITWTSRVSAADNTWRGIAWSPELELFAAVSSNGTGNCVMTSPDGITWTSRVSANDNYWRDVAWSPELGLFAAVSGNGTGNRVMTSANGINWVARVSAADNDWHAIAWSSELELFAAVSDNGTNNRVMTSPDGINWTIRVSAANNAWQDVAWSQELGIYAAVSDTGAGNRVMTTNMLEVESSFTEGLQQLEFYADASDLYLALDGVVTDNVALGGVTAANTTGDLIFINNAIAYADNITLSVAGTQELYFSPTTMLNGATIDDLEATGGDNDGTVTWGSNSGVSITYGGMTSYEEYYATANVTGGFTMPNATMPTTWFAAGENLSSLPFYESFAAVAVQTGQPVQMIYAMAIVGVAFGAFLLIILFTRSALIAYIAMVVVFVFGSNMTIIPWWIVFVLFVTGFGIMYLYRQTAH